MVLLNSVLLEAACDRCKKGSLEEAILLANLGHFGQRDRGGHPYILHPLRVMERVKRFGVITQTVAVLHDLIEDSPYFSEDRLRQCGFSEVVIEALRYLERPKGMTILEAADKLAALDVKNPAAVIAMRVKVADYNENSDLTRYETATEKDTFLANLYLEALQIVSKTLATA